MWAKKQKSGFTIVELLIVIVVVAILAAITVVAYSGVTTRAENTKTTAAVTTYARAIIMYSQLNGSYPAAVWACMADGDNACGRVSGSTPCFGLGNASRNASFDNSVLTTVAMLPKLSDQTMICSTSGYQGGVANSPDATHMNLYFLLRGNQPACPAISGTALLYRTQQDDATFCAVQLPAL